MKVSEKGIELIKKFEGFSKDAYCCPAGVITIGYGFTSDVRLGDQITREEAQKRLVSELSYFENVIEKNVKVQLSQNQFDALISFVYNVGEGAFKKSTLLKNLNKGLYQTVPEQLLRWNKAGKKPLAGLTRRRQAEGMLFSETPMDPEMAQSVDSPDKSIAASRTVQNATVAGTVGIALAAAPAIEPAGKVVELAQNNTQGFLLVLGITILIFAAYAIYIRLDQRKKGF